MTTDDNLVSPAFFLVAAPLSGPVYAYDAIARAIHRHTTSTAASSVLQRSFDGTAAHGSTSSAPAMTAIYTYDAGIPPCPSGYYYGYRYYSPSLGRWLSRDPVGERGHFSWFKSQNTFLITRDILRKYGLDYLVINMASVVNVYNSVKGYLFCDNNSILLYDILGLCCEAEAQHVVDVQALVQAAQGVVADRQSQANSSKTAADLAGNASSSAAAAAATTCATAAAICISSGPLSIVCITAAGSCAAITWQASVALDAYNAALSAYTAALSSLSQAWGDLINKLQALNKASSALQECLKKPCCN